jgi:hypothetical protein
LKPRLFEAVMKEQPADGSTRACYENLKTKLSSHPFLKRYTELGIKEGLFSDAIDSIGKLHDTLVAAAAPALIGRNIISVMPTTETMERFPLDVDAVAYKYAEGAVTRLSGKKNGTVDIYPNILAEASEEWTKEFTEDATWNVMNNMVEKVGRALGKSETTDILALYAGIADSDLAGGDDIANANAVLGWSGLVAAHQAVEAGDWSPNLFVCGTMQKHQLLNDEKFINSVYLPSGQTDLEQGSVGNVLGMNVQSSSLVTNGTAYAIDTRIASCMLMRRDITVEDWYDVKTGKYGVRATTRFGLGILRSSAVAKITGIKTTLT